MPFTFAHPSIVLPLGVTQTKYLDFTALVIGTMAPDFEYFIHFKPIQIVGHTFWGQFYFNLPLIFIMACVYHYLLKAPVISNLPKPFCERYRYLIDKDWRINSISRGVVFCYSALLGAFTHVFWDSFTHKTGYFVERMDALSTYVNVAGLQLPVYKVIQHGSTLLGFGAIILYLWLIQDRSGETSDRIQRSAFAKLKFWTGVALTGMMVVALMFLTSDGVLLGQFVVTTINGFFIGLIVASAACRFQKSRIKL